MNRLAIALGALVFVQGAMAADEPNYGPIPAWVKPAEVPTAIAPDGAPVKQLLQDQQFNLLPQSQEYFLDTVVRIQTAQGLQAMSTVQLPWKPDTDVLTIHKVQIRRGDQVIDALANGQKFTLLRRENNLEYSALDGILTAAFQPPDLRVGDILDIAFSLRRTDPIMAGAAEQIAGGWIQGPVARVNLRARWPRSTMIRWRAADEQVPLKEQTDGDFTEATYTADNIEPPIQATGAPLRFAITRQLEFSGSKSWPEVSKRMAPLYLKAATLAADSPLRAEIARIKSVAHTPIERASAALSLVEDDVRYVFLGMNEGGMVPAPADLTWSRRFGDCKAKTVLLIALLRDLGVEAEPVAVNTQLGDGLDARLPMVGVFDHVLVRAHIDGQVYWLDGTRSGDRRLQSLTTPNYHWGLPLLSAGSELTRIEAVPLALPGRDTHVRIDARAGIFAPAAFHVDTVLNADAAMAMKMRLAALTGDALDRGLREYWSKVYDFVDIKAVAAKFDDAAGTETLSMDGSAHMGWKDQWYETDGLGVGFEAQFTRPAGANLQAPYAVNFPFYIRMSEKIMLPKGGPSFTTSGGEYDRVVAGVEYKRKFSLLDGTFSAEASGRSIKQEFAAAEATEAQAALRAMAKDGLYLREPDQYVRTDADAVAEALAHTPSTAKEYLDRGLTLLAHKDYDHAIVDFDKAHALSPNSDDALANRGLAHLWKLEFDNAASDWDAADFINPKNPTTAGGRGLLALQLNKPADAIAAFTRSLELKPGNVYWLTWRAYAYERTNKAAEAIADSTAVLKSSPSKIPMYRLRGVEYARIGQVDLATADARAVLAENSTLDAYQAAEAIYIMAGKKDEALQAVSHGLEAAPNVQMYLLRANLHPASDRAGRNADVDAALRLDPRSTSTLYVKASYEYDDGQYAAAAASITALMEMDGAKFDYQLLRLRARAKAGQSALAEEDLAQVQAAAKTAPMLNNLCWGLATGNIELGDALKACDAAIAKGPDSAAYRDSRAFVLLRLGRFEESIAAYDTALAMAQNHADSLYGRGLAKRRAGQAKDGQQDIAAAVALDMQVAERYAGYGLKD